MRTELEMVNYILAQVGSAPVTSLGQVQPDVQSAILRLNEASIQLQKTGWWFNTDLYRELTPDVNTGELILPAKTMKIIHRGGEFLVPRDGKAYSPATQSYTFTAPVTCSVVIQMDVADVPAEAQDAITFSAAKESVLIELEDRNKAEQLTTQYQLAMLEVRKSDLEVKRRSVFASPTILNRRFGVRPYRLSGGQVNPRLPGG